MKKILLMLVTILMVIGIGGCSLLENKKSKEYMYKHFSYLEKIYPTEKVDDLFDKFPNGGTLKVSIGKRNENNILEAKYLTLKIDSNQRKLYGTERKENIKNGVGDVVYEEAIEYRDGYIEYTNNETLEKYPITFIFQKLSYTYLRELEVRQTRHVPTWPGYSISYWLPNGGLGFVEEGKLSYVYFLDNDIKNAKIEISDENSTDMFSERFEGNSKD